MPRNPAPAKQKKKPDPKPPEEQPSALEPGEERGVPKVAASLDDIIVRPGIETHLPLGVSVMGEEPKPIEKEPPAPPVQVIERRIETVTVEIPLGEPPHRIRDFHLEVLLHGDHSHTLARLRQALRDKNARTADSHEVKSGPDVLRWLLEQFASC